MTVPQRPVAIRSDCAVRMMLTSIDKNPFEKFVDAAYAGDIAAMRDQARAGFDLTTPDDVGETILEAIIDSMADISGPQRYEVVRETLRLGANPCKMNRDGFGPLFSAILAMDAEMLRILLDVGADPNAEKMDTSCESLYDWAEFDYRYEEWDINDFGSPTEEDRRNEKAWLNYLDCLALRKGRRRPDHLILLRERGALTMAELNASRRE